MPRILKQIYSFLLGRFYEEKETQEKDLPFAGSFPQIVAIVETELTLARGQELLQV